MKKTYSRRKFISTSLKGLAGISLFGLFDCSKKKFWETREYNETLEKIYQLADEIYPKNSYRGNQFDAAMQMRYFDSHEHNPDMINENGFVIDTTNYHPSLHALNETLSYYKVRMAKIKRGEKPPFVRDFFK